MLWYRHKLTAESIDRSDFVLAKVQKLIERKMDQGYSPTMDFNEKMSADNQAQKLFADSQLFVIRIEPFESNFILKIKVKNLDVWACDYNRFKARDGEEDQQ